MVIAMKCFNCGKATFKRMQVPFAITVADIEFATELPGGSCSSCGARTVSGEAGASFELQVASELASRGVRSGETFRFMRKALGMKAADLAEIMNVAAETVSRWENGQRDVGGPEFMLLGFLVDDKRAGRSTVQARARALAEPQAPRYVHLRFLPPP